MGRKSPRIISCMNVDPEVLKVSGSEVRFYSKNSVIFEEEETPQYYYQIISGTVKLNNYKEDGREFIQNFLGENQSFGESLLLIEENYPVNAIALTDCEVIRLPKTDFIALLEKHQELSLQFNACLSHRLYYYMLMMQTLSTGTPELKIKGMLTYLKSYSENCDSYSYQVLLTRQQIADLTGLRVETVIRTLKKMEAENIIRIQDRKIHY